MTWKHLPPPLLCFYWTFKNGNKTPSRNLLSGRFQFHISFLCIFDQFFSNQNLEILPRPCSVFHFLLIIIFLPMHFFDREKLNVGMVFWLRWAERSLEKDFAVNCKISEFSKKIYIKLASSLAVENCLGQKWRKPQVIFLFRQNR